MSQSLGPNINNSGLIFSYDVTDTANSFKGEPTTNIAYATNNNLNSGSNWWINGGDTIFNDNDTALIKPKIPNVDTTNLYIFSSKVTVAGSNQQLGSSVIPVSPSTTYTLSIYFYFTGTVLQAQPYVRGSVNNDWNGYFAYNGDTGYMNWPRNQWIQISCTFTSKSNETGVYLSSYTGYIEGEKLAYFGYQLEEKNHATPLVLGTRSTTNAIVDVTGNSTVTMTNGGFDSNGQIYFDGSNSYGIITNGPMSTITGDVTLAGWFYWNGGTGAPHRTIICTDTAYRHGVKLMSYYHGGLAAWVGNNNGSNDYLLGGGNTPLNSWNMLACTYNTAGGLILYLNGQSINSANTGFLGGTARVSTAMIGREYHSSYEGKLPLSMAYNRILSSSEINKLYTNTKSKFI
jgi:hypothetical protein